MAQHWDSFLNHCNMIQCDYVNPTESLPVPPPSKCRNIFECGSCINCNDLKEWRINFCNTVDDILLRSNIHTCRGGSKEYEMKYNKDWGNSKNIQEKFHPIMGCKSNKYGKCKALFPWKLLKQTVIDPTEFSHFHRWLTSHPTWQCTVANHHLPSAALLPISHGWPVGCAL